MSSTGTDRLSPLEHPRLGGNELGNDKPYAAFDRANIDEALKTNVRSLVSSLVEGIAIDPADHDANKNFITQVEADLVAWAKTNGQSASPRLNPIRQPKH